MKNPWKDFDDILACARITLEEPMKHQLGDAPIEDTYRDMMNGIAGVLDEAFNQGAKGKDRKTGFVLMVFPFDEVATRGGQSRCNYLSNGADRRDIVALMKEMIARFEGQPEIRGKA